MKTLALHGNEYRYLRKRRYKQTMQRKRVLARTSTVTVYSKIFYAIALICISLSIASIGTCFFMRDYYQDEIFEREQDIEHLEILNQDLTNQISGFSTTYQETADILEDVSEMAYELDEENNNLAVRCKDLQAKVNQYEQREELFDEYEWAIMRSDNTRTDITYNRIESLEELAGEKGLSDDSVKLILSLAMTESSGREKAANPKSTARGFGQMLKGTAKFTYETLMGNEAGTYNHDMAFDGDLNLTMMTYYLDHLGVKYSDNVFAMLREYRGEDDAAYDKKLNGYLASAGETLHSIDIRP